MSETQTMSETQDDAVRKALMELAVQLVQESDCLRQMAYAALERALAVGHDYIAAESSVPARPKHQRHKAH